MGGMKWLQICFAFKQSLITCKLLSSSPVQRSHLGLSVIDRLHRFSFVRNFPWAKNHINDQICYWTLSFQMQLQPGQILIKSAGHNRWYAHFTVNFSSAPLPQTNRSSHSPSSLSTKEAIFIRMLEEEEHRKGPNSSLCQHPKIQLRFSLAVNLGSVIWPRTIVVSLLANILPKIWWSYHFLLSIWGENR